MSTLIVDYGAGNLRSAAKAFERAAREAGLATEIVVSGQAEDAAKAERIVLPGVGAFADCRRGLLAEAGLFEAIEARVIGQGAPFLGVCVGMQLMASKGLEHGETPGFGWIPGVVDKIAPSDSSLKIPHMGWNEVRFEPHPVFANLPTDHAYFVHSYHLTPDSPAHLLAETDYAGRIVAAVGRDNLVGTQFHPEKSQALGLALIRNFLLWRP